MTSSIGKYELWAEKYRPTKSSEIVGNLAVVQQLRDFLKGQSKFKAALLSGSPGLGKTTMAHVLSSEMNYKIIEFNASDTRSKTEIIKRIKDTSDFLALNKGDVAKKILIMDEIDGMSSDRGGIAELGALIRNIKTPILCICNDRNNPKMRTLASHCLDLRLRKLMTSQVTPFLRKILKNENKKVPDSVLTEIVTSSHGDIRYCLNTLQQICSNSQNADIAVKGLLKKTVQRNIFDLAGEIFASRNVRAKIDTYFEDYNFLPLFVFENYLKSSNVNLNSIEKAAESLSYADLIDRRIHGASQDWSLLPLHAFYSSVIPTLNRQLRSRLDFPQVLGQRSKRIARLKILSLTATKTGGTLRTSKDPLRLDVLDLLLNIFLHNYSQSQTDRCVEMLIHYNISKEEIEDLCEITFSGKDLLKQISTKAKRALTSALKKICGSSSVQALKKEEKDTESESDHDQVATYDEY